MMATKWLLFLGVLVLAVPAWANSKPLWRCDVTGGQSSLESAEIDTSASGLVGDVMYNRPFDDEAGYDVPVKSIRSRGKIEYKGTARDGGSFDLVLELHGNSPAHARGTLKGVIPSSADPTGFGKETYSRVTVECDAQ